MIGEVKHVQAEISHHDYFRLRNILRERGKTLKQGLKEAIEHYLKEHEEPIEGDTIFKLIGSFETAEGNWSEREDWKRIK